MVIASSYDLPDGNPLLLHFIGAGIFHKLPFDVCCKMHPTPHEGNSSSAMPPGPRANTDSLAVFFQETSTISIAYTNADGQ
jgi:hypothetical protein